MFSDVERMLAMIQYREGTMKHLIAGQGPMIWHRVQNVSSNISTGKTFIEGTHWEKSNQCIFSTG